ncbi:hypothetical protein ZWY2020_006199 [Hordeum vulgare]|nr:hypothetical protein ZWY2020_006199 [Hordeum vulgare]
MVFEDERTDDQSSLPYMHSSNSSTDGIYQVPVSVEDPEYHGLELDIMLFCDKHDRASKRHVAFEDTDTGRSELVADMKGQMAKKDAHHKHLNDKYQLLVNLTRPQATVIQNLKFKNKKEKQVHSEAMDKFELKNAELAKSEEKLTQEKLELKFQIADLLKGKEVHNKERG